MTFQVKWTEPQTDLGREGGGEADSDDSDASSIVSTDSRGERRRGRKRGGRRGRGRRYGEGGAGGERGSEPGYGYTPGPLQPYPKHQTATLASQGQKPPPLLTLPLGNPTGLQQPYPNHAAFTLASQGQRPPPLLSLPLGNPTRPQQPSEGAAWTRKSPGLAETGHQGGKPKPPVPKGLGGYRGDGRRSGSKDGRRSDSKHKQSDKTRKGSLFGAKLQNDADQRMVSSSKEHQQDQQVGRPGETSGITPDVPELSPEEEIEVFSILLRELNGRARLRPLMSKCNKGDLFKGLTPQQIAAWLKNSKSFLTFERDEHVKFVSVWNKRAHCCFKYKKHGTDKCGNAACSLFHICRDFLVGCCSRGSDCHFSHQFKVGSNARISTEAGLQAFTDEEIRIIVLRSGPLACLKFSRGSCQSADCPDIHVCSRYLRGDCPAVASCKIGHMVKGPQHNEWVLQTFNMTHIKEFTLCKLVVAPKPDHEEATGGAQGHPPDFIHKAKNTTERAPGLNTRRGSMDCLLDDTGAPLPRGRGLTKGRSQESLLQGAELMLPARPPAPQQRFTKVSGGAKGSTELIQQKNTDGYYPRVHSTSTQANRRAPSPEATPQIRTQETVDPGYIRDGYGCAPKPQPRYSTESDSIAAVTQQIPPVVEKPPKPPVPPTPKVSGRSEAQSSHDLKPRPQDGPRSGWIAAYVDQTLPPVPKPRTSLQETSRPGEARGGRDPEQQSLAKAAVVDATGAEAETDGGLQHSPASHYAHLCEQYSSTGTCGKGYLCPKFHHPDRLSYVWQIRVYDKWQDFSPADNLDIEEHFRALAAQGDFLVFLDNTGGLQLVLDFQTMVAEVRVSGPHAGIDTKEALPVRRWSTPSYVEADDSNPLSWYTQWCWHRMDRNGYLVPFTPATLQYTLEEKYKDEQKKYYFEEGETRYLILPGHSTHDLVLLDLKEGRQFPVFRRPVYDSAMLLNEKPSCKHTILPAHWSTVDRHQDFEMVELESSGQEYQGVARSFHTTMAREAATILRVFRVQNPSVWDRYCSMRRAMTPRGLSEQDVDERKLFHGTPTLDGARGICANNMDFRRSGDNVGAIFGKGAYFSAHAVYSQRYTSPPDRCMFLARVLVGRYTKGDPSYSMPPVREGLKHYDSCVNDEANPTIFVIFDLAQSYPEYLIQFEDSNSRKVPPMSPLPVSATAPVRQATAMPGMGSGVSGQGSHTSGIVSGLPRPASGFSSVGLKAESRHGATSVSPRAAATSVSRNVAEKKSEKDKCLIS